MDTSTNDAELDKLLSLNRKINAGVTLEYLRKEFEQRVSDCKAVVEKSERDMKTFCDLKEKIAVVFAGKKAAAYTYDQAWAALQAYPNITKQNYRNIEKLIESETENLHQAWTAFKE